jgi:uncharacterized membrane protein SpoIIM required for sporulation
MRQQQFEQEQAETWGHYRELLEQLESGKPLPPTIQVQGFPRLLRTLSGHYALACSRGYSPGLADELHQLVRRGYRQLYRFRPAWPRQLLHFAVAGFPRALRRHARLFWLACALFFGPMLAMGLACYHDGTLIHSLLGGSSVSDLETMYDPTSDRLGEGAIRKTDTDVAMFGYYIMNNVGIAFRTFASGLVFGLGSVFLLAFNGLYIGAAAGHLTQLGHGQPFWSFVSGHGPYELTAIVISGAAGLLLAKALLAPGRLTRAAALRANAAEAVILVTGAMLMLLLAAAVEAFWSSSTAIASPIKYGVGGIGWVIVIAYLGLAGRGEASADDGERADGA